MSVRGAIVRATVDTLGLWLGPTVGVILAALGAQATETLLHDIIPQLGRTLGQR
jgi:hypothetical protein